MPGKSKLFVKLSEKIDFLGNLPGKLIYFSPGSTTPQISNQIDAAVCVLRLKKNTVCSLTPWLHV